MQAAAPEPEEPTVPQRSNLGRSLAGALLGLVALVGLLLAGLNSGPGRNLVARQLSGMTFANGLRIEVGRIEGSLYGETRLIGVTAYDTRGPFLHAPLIELDWRPFAYFANHVDIRSAAAQTVVLQRVPAFKVTRPDAPLLPDLNIDIDRLRIDRLIAEPAVSGERRELQLTGKAKIAVDHGREDLARADAGCAW